MLVKKFYNLIPFNIGKDKKEDNIPWPIVVEKLSECSTVTELGCGTGWLSSRIKNKFPNISVKGIDLSESAIGQATLRSDNVNFTVDDITTYSQPADMIISLGVLHHIPNHDIKELMLRAIHLSNKYTFIGLYHQNSRQAMFDFFNSYPVNKRKNLFKKMTPQIKDEDQRNSWYRDQFDHPYEQAVSLELYNEIAKKTNTKLVYSNIESDDTYDATMDRLNTYEFVSGFIYGVFQHEMD